MTNEILNKIEDYKVDFKWICKDMLVYGADVEKMQENSQRLLKLNNSVDWYYGFLEDSDVESKQNMLNRVNHVRINIRWLLDRIYRYIETDNFTDYYSVVKGCVEIIG